MARRGGPDYQLAEAAHGRAAGPRTPAVAYTMAAAVVTAAILLRYVLDPWMGETLPLVTLFGAVAAAVWLGGPAPAAVGAIVGYLICDYLFIAPRGEIDLTDVGTAVGAVAYVFTCAIIIAAGGVARRAQHDANARQELLRVTLRSIGDAVITTDVDGRVTYMNAVAETLTGWSLTDANRQPLETVFRVVSEGTRAPVENPAAKALREGVVVGLANHTVLLGKTGGECPIDDSAAPITDERGTVSGCVLIFRDVASQRREAHARASQLLTARVLASIIESSDDAIISKSLDGVIQSWNAGAERLFGYRAAEAVGRHITMVIPPERISEEDQIIASLKAGERIEHFETERLASDGRRLRVSLTVSPVRDDSGRVVGASKIVRDVTRQRQAEHRERQLLAETAAANVKFQAFFEQGPLFAFIMGLDGTILDANRRSWEACGFTKDQILGKPFWQGPWWTPSAELVERIKAASARAATGEVVRAELPYFVADGSRRMADVTIQPITDDTGQRLFLAPTGIDITDRTLAEAERQKFVTIAEYSTDFIAVCDLDGLPIFINRAGLELVGLDSIEAARRTPLASFFFPEDQSMIMETFLPSVLAQGHGEVEVRFRHFSTGAAHWMAYKVLALPDATGRPVAFATVSQDVTPRKRLEDGLRGLAADLSEADRRKNEFLAMLAHELRNPLAPISNAARVLRHGGSDHAALAAASEMLERQVTQMGRLVDDLLDMSRVTRGRIDLRREVLELAPVVHQALEAVRAQFADRHHDVVVTLPTEPLYVDADPARLAQVIGNLLNNACKFTDGGGQVRLTATRDGAEVVIQVSDDGIGIAAEHLPQLFEMFAQVDTSLERTRHGLGIGLTLVKSLVEMHGGSVAAHSAGPGRGSEFTVRLPAASPLPRLAAPSAPAVPAATPRRRVLIVDDNEDAATSLEMLLRLSGHEPHRAHDGVEAVEAAERLRPDAVLLDIGLPRMNGYEACRRIRAQPGGRDILLIALTGWGQDSDRAKSEEAGFDTHIVKPPDFDQLMALLAAGPVRSAERDPVG